MVLLWEQRNLHHSLFFSLLPPTFCLLSYQEVRRGGKKAERVFSVDLHRIWQDSTELKCTKNVSLHVNIFTFLALTLLLVVLYKNSYRLSCWFFFHLFVCFCMPFDNSGSYQFLGDTNYCDVLESGPRVLSSL